MLIKLGLELSYGAEVGTGLGQRWRDCNATNAESLGLCLAGQLVDVEPGLDLAHEQPRLYRHRCKRDGTGQREENRVRRDQYRYPRLAALFANFEKEEAISCKVKTNRGRRD